LDDFVLLSRPSGLDLESPVDKKEAFPPFFVYFESARPDFGESSPNLCVNYFFSRALVVQGMPLHPCLCTSTLEGAVKGAPLRTSKRFP
jgi:hypothetical protein